MQKHIKHILCLCAAITMAATVVAQPAKEPVDWVNPYIGNISHLLVPTFPTVSLPNSMLRVIPNRKEFTQDLLTGISLATPGHRRDAAFNISPLMGDEKTLKPFAPLSWSSEKVTPYSYSVLLDDQFIRASAAVSHQSAIFSFAFTQQGNAFLVAAVDDGELTATADGNGFSGFQILSDGKSNTLGAKIYIWAEFDRAPVKKGALLNAAAGDSASAKKGKGAKKGAQTQAQTKSAAASIDPANTKSSGRNAALAFAFGDAQPVVKMRYGISFISVEQAKANLRREIPDSSFDMAALAARGRKAWNDVLGLLNVSGADDRAKAVFYTAFYRVSERPVCISEDGKYYSGYDGKIHDDNGTPFYVDDWIWDTYRAAHPLRVLIEPKLESDIINSYIRMAGQTAARTGHFWMPTFPEVTGDTHRMNSNHTAAIFADAWAKGLHTFDLAKAYEGSKNAITQKTLIPWSGAPAGPLDDFYKKHGYFPALPEGAKEPVPEVSPFEHRQPVAVTLGTSYDEWCLSRMAGFLGRADDEAHFAKCGLNYENLYNPKTAFFHPKDAEGNFIMPFDYKLSGGHGGREFYDENNGWTYRWDVQQNIAGLIALMGGRDKFNANLDTTFAQSVGSKWQFYTHFPDSTSMHGMFSMGNEPSFHIPYLYNFSGEPWKTQKKVRTLLREWYRDDMIGVPGDEDGGGMSAFVIFSMLGFYPITPGLPMYIITSPVFEHATVNLPNGKTFEVIATNYSPDNIYIQSVTLNGKPWNKPWFEHADIADGGKMIVEMGDTPNKQWGAAPGSEPPSGYPAK